MTQSQHREQKRDYYSDWDDPRSHPDQYGNEKLEGETCGKSTGFQSCLLQPGHAGPCNGWPSVLPVPKKVDLTKETK